MPCSFGVEIRMNKSFAVAVVLSFACARESVQAPPATVTGSPQLRHYEFRVDQLPPPYATPSAGNPPRVTSQPAGATLHVPPGFSISVYAADLEDPRHMILAPNGDVIVSEPGAGKITILRDGKKFTFASNLNNPYGLALHDRWLYIGDEDAIVRLAYTP
ncbi:MAG TPA: hypothetical protein VK137_19950, partial [Planctomycetaceae bacterium]|nr:hypothetical protein [Planctomycetaceae bacterium]